MLNAASGTYLGGVCQDAKKNFWRITFLAVLLVAIAIGSMMIFRALNLEGLGQYGYTGAFLLGFSVNVTLFLPPVFFGATFPPLLELTNQLNLVLVASAYACGGTIGELSGYAVGMESSKLLRILGFFGIQRRRKQQKSRPPGKIERLLVQSGLWIVFLAITPIPPFDMTGIIAGGMRYPVWKFLLACFVGRTGKYLFLLTVGGLAWNVF
ncbi:MAG: hypothetical protein A3D64_00035 [Candidatus Wildermuthbacteria bacterium RIFCSPHIGHO2_02_FULL_49_9]|uniref:VTT domain-containing protein n=2 Tax=Candidatus Wildermuthiibacteriota TaxID=1817923 RepID=A0A1G2QZA3_9BACT|nr:MAG: hypothetical protein A2672_02700 [Candidatus Wildermuthbacteria bacterium RIFCSPHIGHO2_01_FULL_49_22b]OHA71042.1 MAG: hypothetical protein A3D64_00035 [Candidatus Wildermuthbacteria bacterium RIFCSPHIGHO2_02_FULL_49_9]